MTELEDRAMAFAFAREQRDFYRTVRIELRGMLKEWNELGRQYERQLFERIEAAQAELDQASVELIAAAKRQEQ